MNPPSQRSWSDGLREMPSPATGGSTRILAALWQGCRWIASRIQRDHSTIELNHYVSVINPSWFHPHIQVLCAPSRKLRRRVPSGAELVDRGVQLHETLFPGAFPDRPSHLDGHNVSFEVMLDHPTRSTELDRGLWLRDVGLLEVYWPIRIRPQNDEPVTLPVIEALWPVWQVARAVENGTYWSVVRRPHVPFLWQIRRLDWRVVLATGLTNDDHSPREYGGLAFPGEEPSDRATGGRPACAVGGIAPRRLRGARQRLNPDKVVELVLRELLRQTQYFGNEEAVVADVLSALKAMA